MYTATTTTLTSIIQSRKRPPGCIPPFFHITTVECAHTEARWSGGFESVKKGCRPIAAARLAKAHAESIFSIITVRVLKFRRSVRPVFRGVSFRPSLLLHKRQASHVL